MLTQCDACGFHVLKSHNVHVYCTYIHKHTQLDNEWMNVIFIYIYTATSNASFLWPKYAWTPTTCRKKELYLLAFGNWFDGDNNRSITATCSNSNNNSSSSNSDRDSAPQQCRTHCMHKKVPFSKPSIETLGEKSLIERRPNNELAQLDLTNHRIRTN